MFNPNGSSSITIELDAPESGTNNIFFNALRAMPDLKRALHS
jgi:hypothetical protein